MIDGDAPRIRTELQVMFFDTDCGGVVHNIAYLRFVEVARTLLAEKLGLTLVKMALWPWKGGSIDSNAFVSGARFVLSGRRIRPSSRSAGKCSL